MYVYVSSEVCFYVATCMYTSLILIKLFLFGQCPLPCIAWKLHGAFFSWYLIELKINDYWVRADNFLKNKKKNAKAKNYELLSNVWYP